jgi:anaerobic magnesium-protoporphyrin IX monomethyl ester cyclase
MNITLVNTSARMSSDGSRLISSLLKRAGHSVTTVFMARPEPMDYHPGELDALHELLRNTDILMVAVYSSYAVRARQVTDYVRKRYPGLMVLWGGPHCISAPELSLQHADCVCFSEGDEVIVDLVNKIESGRNYLDCPNMAFNVDGAGIVNRVLPPFPDLDGLPYADYDLNDQFLLDRGLFQMRKNLLKKHLAGYPFYIPTLYLTTSRGCPYNCSYCNNSRYISMFGQNPMRFYSSGRILLELKHILEKLDFVDFIGFGDDDFFMRPGNEIEEFAEAYRKTTGLPFGIAISANNYRREKLESLLEAGLRAVQVGVQSGSRRVLSDIYNRKIKLTKAMSVIREMSSYQEDNDLHVLVDFIIDNPYETRRDIMETYSYILGMPSRMKINLFFLSFFPGTPIYERALKDGIISKANEEGFRFFTRSCLKYQKNYETFLIILLRNLRRDPVLQKYFTKYQYVMRILDNRLMRSLGSVLPESVYLFLSKKFH